jgi:hypothetical protein
VAQAKPGLIRLEENPQLSPRKQAAGKPNGSLTRVADRPIAIRHATEQVFRPL